MKILGIGNAIVDVLCKVSDDFLIKKLTKKSTMKLIDETEFENSYLHLKLKKLFLVVQLQTQLLDYLN